MCVLEVDSNIWYGNCLMYGEVSYMRTRLIARRNGGVFLWILLFICVLLSYYAEAGDFDSIKWIVMSDAGYGYRTEDYERFKSIGIEAVLVTVDWNTVETASGSYNFSQAIESYERCRAAGLIWIPQLAVHYKPSWLCNEDYYYRFKDGSYYSTNDMPPNYFNPNTQYYVERFIAKFAEAFSGYLDDIPLVFVSIGQLGESYYPNGDNFAAFDNYTIAAWRSYTGNGSAMPYSSSTANDGSGGSINQFVEFWYNKMYEYITYTSNKVGQVMPYSKIGIKAAYNLDLGQNPSSQLAAVPASLRGVISFGGPSSQISGLEKIGRVAHDYGINCWMESFIRDYDGKSNSIELTVARMSVNNISGMMYGTILDLMSADWPPPAFQVKDEFYLYQELINSYDSYVQRFTTWYLAEGSTFGDFDEYVLIQNPTLNRAQVMVTFMREDPDAPVDVRMVYVEPTSRFSIRVKDAVANDSVSVKVESLNNVVIVVERAMYWNGWTGAHGSPAVRSLSNTWYLAEGYTSSDMDEYVLIQNPNDVWANVDVTFMLNTGENVSQSIDIGPNKRYTIWVNEFIPNAEVSTQVVSDVGIVVERSMYWNAGGQRWRGGHCGPGVTSASNTWYLAEGSTEGFEEWILIQNPNDIPARATLELMTSGGSALTRSYDIGPKSRYTIHVNKLITSNAVSAKVTSDENIIVERSMYWNVAGAALGGGHNSTGVTSTGVMWFLAEGSTDGFNEWVLIQNPDPSLTAQCKVTFMRPDGTVEKIDVNVPPSSRRSVEVDAVYALDKTSVSTKIESTNGVGIIVERAMYLEANGVTGEGHDAVGVT